MQKKVRNSGAAALCAGVCAAMMGASAHADDAAASPDKAVTFSGYASVDLVGALSGGESDRLREVDKESITAAVDFDKLIGWRGGSGSFNLMNASGGKPNGDIGTLQGIDSNEVGSRRARLYEAWVQQDFNGHGSLKAGLIDLNTEFYVNDASSVLLAPESGIGSELAATGPGGPSTYPQTALAVRLSLQPTKSTYLLAGAFNAHVGDPGDHGGVDTSFDEGVIEIVEGGWAAEGMGKLAIGGWRYSKTQDDLHDTNGVGDPIGRTSQGVYLLAQKVLIDGGDKGRTVTGFVRAGISDGKTGPFKSSWQTGVLIDHAVASRPDSQISLGIDQAQLGDSFRANAVAAHMPLTGSETHMEATYLDKLNEHLTIQPDLQYVIDPGGAPRLKDALVGLLRVTASF